MTLILGFIAAVLLGLILAAIFHSNRHDDTLSFTLPQDLNAGVRAQPLSSQAFVRPGDLVAATATPTAPSFEDAIAEKEAAAVSRANAEPATFLPGNLGVGTSLTYRGEDSLIRGVLSFDFNGELWQDYLVQEDDGDWWRLAVEPDRSLRLAIYTRTQVAIEPGDSVLTFSDGSTYQLAESGKANYRSAGVTHQFDSGQYFYFDYKSTKGHLLSFERFDNSPWQTSIGHRVDPTQVQICNRL